MISPKLHYYVNTIHGRMESLSEFGPKLIAHKIIHLVHDSMLPHATASHTVLLLAMKSAGDRGVGGWGGGVGLWAKQTLAGHKGKKSGI